MPPPVAKSTCTVAARLPPARVTVTSAEVELAETEYVADLNWRTGGALTLIVRTSVLIDPSVAPPVGWLSVRFTVAESAVWAGLFRTATLKVWSIWPGWNVKIPDAASVVLPGDRRAVAGGVGHRDDGVGIAHALHVDEHGARGHVHGVGGRRNCTLTGWAETALENSEVSPVRVLVAVAVIQMFAASPAGGL